MRRDKAYHKEKKLHQHFGEFRCRLKDLPGAIIAIIGFFFSFSLTHLAFSEQRKKGFGTEKKGKGSYSHVQKLQQYNV